MGTKQADGRSSDTAIQMRLFKPFFKHPLVAGSLALGGCIALFAPTTILGDHAWLRQYVDTVASLFPSVAGYEARSQFPEVSALYFAAMIPFGLAWMVLAMRAPPQLLIGRFAKLWQAIENRRPTRYLWMAITLCLVLGAFAIFVFQPGYDFHILPLNSRRGVLAIGGVLFSAGPFLLLATAWHMVRLEVLYATRRRPIIIEGTP